MTSRPLPPQCMSDNGWRARHWFHPGTSRPNSITDERYCRNCGLYMVANSAPPRAKVRLNWRWPMSAFMPKGDHG